LEEIAASLEVLQFDVETATQMPEECMHEPECPKKGPYTLELDTGSYWWCACGASKTQPFCDGSHKGTGFEPLKLELSGAKKVWLCGCKRSADKPMCDGSHKKLI
jgi:CDGSH iron-sulfur domain-containing protein 3